MTVHGFAYRLLLAQELRPCTLILLICVAVLALCLLLALAVLLYMSLEAGVEKESTHSRLGPRRDSPHLPGSPLLGSQARPHIPRS